MGLPVKLSHWHSDIRGPQVKVDLPVLLLQPPERLDMLSAHSRKDEDGYTDMGWQLAGAIDRVAGVEDTNVHRYSLRLELAEQISLDQILTDLQTVLRQLLGPDLTVTVCDREVEQVLEGIRRRARLARYRKQVRAGSTPTPHPTTSSNDS